MYEFIFNTFNLLMLICIRCFHLCKFICLEQVPEVYEELTTQRVIVMEYVPSVPTPHPTPYTLHSTPNTLHPPPHTQQPTPHTLHSTPHTLHPTLHTYPPLSHLVTIATTCSGKIPGINVSWYRFLFVYAFTFSFRLLFLGDTRRGMDCMNSCTCIMHECIVCVFHMYCICVTYHGSVL